MYKVLCTVGREPSQPQLIGAPLAFPHGDPKMLFSTSQNRAAGSSLVMSSRPLFRIVPAPARVTTSRIHMESPNIANVSQEDLERSSTRTGATAFGMLIFWHAFLPLAYSYQLWQAQTPSSSQRDIDLDRAPSPGHRRQHNDESPAQPHVPVISRKVKACAACRKHKVRLQRISCITFTQS